MINCTVTIYRKGVTYDPDTGYRKQGNQLHVLKDVPAFLAPAKAQRIANKEGLSQYSKPSFGLLIEDQDAEIEIGMFADVTQRGETVRYTVTEALPVEGFLTVDWQLDLERIKT